MKAFLNRNPDVLAGAEAVLGSVDSYPSPSLYALALDKYVAMVLFSESVTLVADKGASPRLVQLSIDKAIKHIEAEIGGSLDFDADAHTAEIVTKSTSASLPASLDDTAKIQIEHTARHVRHLAEEIYHEKFHRVNGKAAPYEAPKAQFLHDAVSTMVDLGFSKSQILQLRDFALNEFCKREGIAPLKNDGPQR